MTPKRHDDVEDVVGRVRGDVTPEEPHELSALPALVSPKPAGRVDSANIVTLFFASATMIGNGFSHPDATPKSSLST